MDNNNELTGKSDNIENAMQIAMFYTQEDREKSEQMVSGSYMDLYTLKIKFSTPMMYGACIIFLNREFFSLTDFYGIVSQSYSVDDIQIDNNWKDFENEIISNMNKEEHDGDLVLNFLEIIKNGFTLRLIKDILNLIEINDINAVSGLLKKHVLEKLRLQDIKVDFAYEELSSLNMELNSKTSVKLTPGQLFEKENKSDANKIEDIVIEKEDDISIKSEDIKLILKGDLILDPTRGMHIKGLVVKDCIKVRINDDNPKAPLIAKAFNAFKDGRMYPIIGKIISYRRKMGGGYKIFVEIADGIYIRIDEDESNIKVSFVSPSPDRPPELQKGMEKYVDKFVEQQRKEELKRNPQMQSQSRSKKEVNQTQEVNIPLVVTIVGLIIIIIVLIFVIAI